MAVVLVTGGSSGLGLALVRRLAAAGDRVFVASRNPAATALPDGVTPLVLDVTEPGAAEAVISAVVGAAGTLDVLVNNAGHHVLAPLEETAPDDVRQIFEVDLFGPLRLALAAMPIMRAQGAGHIVNVTSISDVLPSPFGGWYSAAKAGMASISAVLDAEVSAFGVRVTVVAPGLFRTKMAGALGGYDVADDSPYRDVFRAFTARERENWPRAGDPDDFAEVVERCIRADSPPARVVVGDDATEMQELVRTKTADEYADLLRGFMARLAAG